MRTRRAGGRAVEILRKCERSTVTQISLVICKKPWGSATSCNGHGSAHSDIDRYALPNRRFYPRADGGRRICKFSDADDFFRTILAVSVCKGRRHLTERRGREFIFLRSPARLQIAGDKPARKKSARLGYIDRCTALAVTGSETTVARWSLHFSTVWPHLLIADGSETRATDARCIKAGEKKGLPY